MDNKKKIDLEFHKKKKHFQFSYSSKCKVKVFFLFLVVSYFSFGQHPVFRLTSIKETIEQISLPQETYNLMIGDQNLLLSLNLYSNSNDSFLVCSKQDLFCEQELHAFYKVIGDNYLTNESKSLTLGFKLVQPYNEEYLPFREFGVLDYFHYQFVLDHFRYLKELIRGTTDVKDGLKSMGREIDFVRFVHSERTSRIFNQVLTYEIFNGFRQKRLFIGELITSIPFGAKKNYLIITMISLKPKLEDIKLIKFIRNSMSLEMIDFIERKLNFDNNTINIETFDLKNEADVRYNKGIVLNIIRRCFS